MPCILIRGEQRQAARAQRRGPCEDEAEIGGVRPQVKNTSSCQKLEKAKSRFCPHVSRGAVALPTLWFWLRDTDLDLRDLELGKIDFCCYRALSLWQVTFCSHRKWTQVAFHFRQNKTFCHTLKWAHLAFWPHHYHPFSCLTEVQTLCQSGLSQYPQNLEQCLANSRHSKILHKWAWTKLNSLRQCLYLKDQWHIGQIHWWHSGIRSRN